MAEQYSITSSNDFLGLWSGASFGTPNEIAPTNCPFISIKSTNSLYAKQVFAIHNVPYPNSVAVNNMFWTEAPIDSVSQIL